MLQHTDSAVGRKKCQKNPQKGSRKSTGPVGDDDTLGDVGVGNLVLLENRCNRSLCRPLIFGGVITEGIVELRNGFATKAAVAVLHLVQFLLSMGLAPGEGKAQPTTP